VAENRGSGFRKGASIMQTLITLVIMLSIVGIVVAIGLDATLDDLLSVLRRPWVLAKAVLAVNVIVPLAAVLLVAMFPLSQLARLGVLLMAISPVPPLVPAKELKAGADKAYAYGLYTALVLLAVIIVPLSVEILGRFYGVEVSLPVPLIARNIALTVLLPLAAGLAVRRYAPAFAKRAAPAVRGVANILLLLAIAPLLVVAWPAMMALIGNGSIAAMALTAATGLAAGHFLGGPSIGERAALAMASATRHPGIALMIATANAFDRRVLGAILLMLLVGLAAGVPYQMWLKRRARGPSPAVARG
jgi:BASS family bile acid:Na+ symporter